MVVEEVETSRLMKTLRRWGEAGVGQGNLPIPPGKSNREFVRTLAGPAERVTESPRSAVLANSSPDIMCQKHLALSAILRVESPHHLVGQHSWLANRVPHGLEQNLGVHLARHVAELLEGENELEVRVEAKFVVQFRTEDLRPADQLIIWFRCSVGYPAYGEDQEYQKLRKPAHPDNRRLQSLSLPESQADATKLGRHSSLHHMEPARVPRRCRSSWGRITAGGI